MRRAGVVVVALLLAGCGEFHLAKGGTIPAGKTQEQVRLDVLECKDRARVESQSAADQARGFLLGAGLSFVGVAIDYQQQKDDQRRIYKDCMEARGYTVIVATD
jgi:hypothetical protein